jgi:hypothetical protein
MDPTPERLVLQPPLPPGLQGQTCQSIAANPGVVLQIPGNHTPNEFSCRPDNVAFRNLIAELGFVMAPSAMHPARTTGVGGFALTVEASYTKINADAFSTAQDGTKTQYWHQGTQGAVDSQKNFSVINNSPDALMQLYSLRARKGLPFGFELTASLGLLSNTSMWVMGADVRWSILEGFRTGALGILPDASVGGGVRTLTGTSKLRLTTVGIDAQLSKPIPLADAAQLTPYVGYQRLIIFGNSNTIDATPNVDAFQQCGYAGIDQNPNTGKGDGSPICRNKLTSPSGAQIDNNSDFNNNITFDSVVIHRHRGIVGLNYRYEVLFLASQFAFDLTTPDSENADLQSTRQWTLSFEAGVFF